MTLSLRNAILLIGLALNLLLLGGMLLGLGQIAPAENLSPLDPLEIGRWSLRAYDGQLAALFAIEIFTFFSVLILYLRFRKTASPEIFFFLLYLLSLGAEGMSILPAVMRSLQAPIYTDILIVKIIQMARLFGVFSLFGAGLFANGMQYQKLSIAFGIALLTAFTFASLLPVPDPGYNLQNGNEMHQISDLMIVVGILKILSVINFIVAWIRNSIRDYLWLGVASAAVLLGSKGLLEPETAWIRIPAIIALLVGVRLFARRTHEIYLWI